MKITLLVTGKTDESYLQQGISRYADRLKHYADFNIEVIPDIKKHGNIPIARQKLMEGEKILARGGAFRELHLFDENGATYTSVEFATFLEKKMVSGLKELVLVIGGPYGFSDEVYAAAASKISLSRMTFSHQLARLLCVEQIYRAFTIIRGEPYHHN